MIDPNAEGASVTMKARILAGRLNRGYTVEEAIEAAGFSLDGTGEHPAFPESEAFTSEDSQVIDCGWDGEISVVVKQIPAWPGGRWGVFAEVQLFKTPMEANASEPWVQLVVIDPKKGGATFPNAGVLELAVLYRDAQAELEHQVGVPAEEFLVGARELVKER